MRVGIACLMHESNTFIPERTTLADFERDLLVEGDAVCHRMANAHHEVGGFLEQLNTEGIEAVPLLAARAWPHGPIAYEAASALRDRVLHAIDRAGRLDGLLVAPHGAAVAESHLDFDGHWLSEVRKHVGTSIPIVGTLDLHANVSPRMVGACEALIAYRTNPHLDQRDRGREAASLMVKILRGEVRPITADAYLPLAVNIACQSTDESPCRELIAETDRIRAAPGVLSASLLFGFPYADVEEMGASVLVTTDNDAIAAQQHADHLASFWWCMRAAFDTRLITPAEAVAQAKQLSGPVCLLDTGDNVGAGTPGDGTLIAHELWRQNVGPAVVVLTDPDVVHQLSTTNIGERVRLRIGGKNDHLHGEPIEAEYVLRSRNDGHFTESQPRHGGITAYDQGPTVVVETSVLTIVVTSKRMMPVSLNQLTSCGLDPSRYHVLVAKGVHAPVAAYAPICKHLMRVGTPGVSAADLSGFGYTRRRRSMFPFERDGV